MADVPPIDPDEDTSDGARRWLQLAAIVAAIVILLIVVMVVMVGLGGHRPPGVH